MHDMQYSLLTEVFGRWKAEIIESFLRSEEIDAVLIPEGVSHSTQQTTFVPVKIYVPKANLTRAWNLIKVFNESQDATQEN